MGYDFDKGRLDLSAHPFTTSFHPTDVRVTTRVYEQDLPSCLFSCIHEGGHGLYDQGLDPAYYGTPLGESVSLGIHESQSRLWENCVGRSRAFWKYFYPILRSTFEQQLRSDFSGLVRYRVRGLQDPDALTGDVVAIARDHHALERTLPLAFEGLGHGG